MFPFWQEGVGYERNLFEAESIEESLTYLDLNAVRKSLCTKASQWNVSSARHYAVEAYDFESPVISNLPPSCLTNVEYKFPISNSNPLANN